MQLEVLQVQSVREKAHYVVVVVIVVVVIVVVSH